jgi:LPXTG-motif cell wall-anchored protein
VISFRRALTASVFIVAVSSLAVSGAAIATPTSQGGPDGVLFMSEASDGTIYVGDFLNPPTAKSEFWHSSGSMVDEVAVTATRIGWSSYMGSAELTGKVLIANLGTTAGTVTTVDVPGTGGITGLAASVQDERFYAVRNDKIYMIPSDGSAATLALTDSSLSGVVWGLWADGYNQRVYWCSAGDIHSADMNGDGTLTNSTLLFTDTNPDCDGIGIDPVDGRLYMASYNSSPRFSSANADGTGSVTEITATDVPAGGAPSSMFVNHDSGTIYLATESNVYEMDFDGSNVRSLYTGTHGGAGFENLAVAYGATLDNIDNGGNSGGGSNGGGSGNGGGANNNKSSELAATGSNSVNSLLIAGLLVASGIALAARGRRSAR